MKIREILLTGILGTTLLGVIIALYVSKPGDCTQLREYGPYNQQYNVGFPYGGGQEKSVLRTQETKRLYDKGYFPYIVPLGTQDEVNIMRNTLINSGVLPEAIIQPVEYSTTTRTNIETGNRTVKERNLGNRIAHISGKEHLRRIKRDNSSLSVELDPSDDGFFPVDDGFGKPFYRLLPSIGKIKADSDLTAWYACMTR